MARRRRDNGDSSDLYDEMEPRGDYYAQSDNGLPDTRPQRRRNEDRPRHRDDRDRPRRGNRDDYGYAGEQPETEEKNIGKTILKVVLIVLLALLSFLGGAFGSLSLAGNGALPEGLMNAFHLGGEEPDEEDLLSTYGEDIEQAVKDGTVRDLLDQAAAEEESGYDDSTATADPYADQTATDATGYAGTDITTNPMDPTQQQIVDPTQQQVVDPTQQQVVDPTQQQIVDPTQQVVDPTQQVVDPTQQVVDPAQQQQIVAPLQQQG